MVTVAKTAGFCYGVKRAVDIALEAASEYKNVYTFGALIHNNEVINDLKEKNIFPIEEDDLYKVDKGYVIIRSHGIPKDTLKRIEESGHIVIDATCPYVKKIHKAVERYSKEGFHIVICGDINHAEVKGIVGWIEGDAYSTVNSKDDAQKFSLNKTNKICIVSQTTFNNNKFKEYVEIIKQKGYDVFTLNTICSATNERQKETEEIASKVGAMIVIGDRNSSNSRKLFEIAKSKCKSYFIQTVSDLKTVELNSIETVGITAGASTPDKIIREVILECQK